MDRWKNISSKIIKDELFYQSLIIVAFAVIAYLPFINQLGFYRDDWYAIWAPATQGLSTLLKMFSIDRPLMGLVYLVSSKVLGGNVLAWQLFAFILRVACSFIFFWLVKMLWPDQKIPVLIMTIIFTIYPGFLMQPNANTFQNHFICYGFCLLSIALSIKVFLSRGKTQKILLTLLAVLSGLIYLFIYEYVIGMELVRIVLFFLLINRVEPKIKVIKAIYKTITYWLPYALMILAFMFWRLVIFKSARSSTDISALLPLYLQNPLGTLLKFLIEGILGILNSVIFAWGVPAYELSKNISNNELIIGLLISILAGLCILYFLYKSPKIEIKENWKKEVIIVGLISIIATILPVVLLNRNIRLDNTFNRYTYQSTFAIALLVVGLVYYLIKNQKMTYLIFSILFTIAIFTHFLNGIYYKKFWDVQRSIWWQLSWRAPSIKDDTTLVVFTPDAYRFAESYEIWAPANTIYHPEPGPLKISAEIPNNETLPLMLFQKTVGRQMRRVEFTVDFKQMLLISLPDPTICMHVIDGTKSEISDYEGPTIRLLSTFSRSSLIYAEGEDHHPPENIFGQEPNHDWCYYFQKASLARQKEDWQEIVRLGEQVWKLGFRPNDLSEWMPFYEGFVKGHRIDLANEVGALIRMDQTFIWQFCSPYTKTDWSKEDKMFTFFITNICGVMNKS
jgi:hypothetical protein